MAFLTVSIGMTYEDVKELLLRYLNPVNFKADARVPYFTLWCVRRTGQFMNSFYNCTLRRLAVILVIVYKYNYEINRLQESVNQSC